MARITGSRAYERFTGPQMLRLATAASTAEAWAHTHHVSLVSSFLASLLCGCLCPIDRADGSGMNLSEIATGRWSPLLLAAMEARGAAGTRAKLALAKASDDEEGTQQDADAPAIERSLAQRFPDGLCPSAACLGPIAPYFVRRFGFKPGCTVVAGSGDNPCSLAGLGLAVPGDVAVSLGTSDTLFGLFTPEAVAEGESHSPQTQYGHVFVSPIALEADAATDASTAPSTLMAMLCYKNGSLARERIRDAVNAVESKAAQSSWDRFNACLASTPPGNGGMIGFYHFLPEIIPEVPTAGIRRFRVSSPPTPPASVDQPAFVLEPLDAASSTASATALGRADVRAIAEGQFLSMRIHGEATMGLRSRLLSGAAYDGAGAPGASGGRRVLQRVIATGGGSKNAALLQVLADVMGCDVYRMRQTDDSAALGAAVRAMHAWANDPVAGDAIRGKQPLMDLSFEHVYCNGVASLLGEDDTAADPNPNAKGLELMARPDPAAFELYTRLYVPAYAAAEQQLVCST
jgi:xylulokinase